MTNKKEGNSLINQFAENLIAIPGLIIEGALNAMEDEGGKVVIEAYSKSFKNQFLNIANLIKEQQSKVSKETLRGAEELLMVTSGVDLTKEVKAVTANLNSNIAKIGLVGIIQMIKKIIKWLIQHIFKKLPRWINSLIDLIDEILNEFFGIGNPTLANILSQKEQNYSSELAKLAVLDREERYLFENSDDD